MKFNYQIFKAITRIGFNENLLWDVRKHFELIIDWRKIWTALLGSFTHKELILCQNILTL